MEVNYLSCPPGLRNEFSLTFIDDDDDDGRGVDDSDEGSCQREYICQEDSLMALNMFLSYALQAFPHQIWHLFVSFCILFPTTLQISLRKH